MKKLFFVQVIFFLSISFCTISLAKVPEPSNILHGKVTIGEEELTSADTNVVITAEVMNSLVASYRMGNNEPMGNEYLLLIPVDAVGEREPNTARVGDTVTVFVAGIRADSFTLADRGKILNKNLTVDALDSDGDGIPDYFEQTFGTNPFDPNDADADPDLDGLSNLDEYLAGTNPNKADTDGDGMGDGYEVSNNLNPNNNSDASLDSDGDGLSNLQEFQNKTDAQSSDTDSDGIPDHYEVTKGLNPLSALDADEDYDLDGYSNLEEYQNETDPLVKDTPIQTLVNLEKNVEGHIGDVIDLAATDWQLISAGYHDAQVKIWSRSDGELLKYYDITTENGINAIDFRDGKIAVGTADATVEVWNLDTDSKLYTFDQTTASVLDVLIFETTLLAGTSEGDVYSWDLLSGDLLSSWNAHESFISGLAMNSGKFYSLGTFPQKELKIWDYYSGEALYTITGTDVCCSVIPIHITENKLVIAGNQDKNTITMISLVNSDTWLLQGLTGNVISVSANDRHLLSGEGNGTLKTWNLTTGILVNSMSNAHTGPIRTILMVDEQVITGASDGLIKYWSIEEVIP